MFDNTIRYDHLRDVVQRIDGWLQDYAALQTMYLLDVQQIRGFEGCLIEIGLYKGKHFSILVRAGKQTGEGVYGIDNMQFVPETDLRKTLETFMPGASYTIFPTSSLSFTSTELLENIRGQRARFFSVDGSHEVDDVMWDLHIAEDAITPEGVISVDDFMNWTAIGVNDAVHRFFRLQRKVVPVAMSSNKLFLCRPHMAAFYREVFQGYAENDAIDETSRRFVEKRAQWTGSVEARLWGFPILTFV